jgi:exopolysaccharide production protein ExoY
MPLGFMPLAGSGFLDVILVLLCAPLWLPVIACIWLLSWLEAGQGFYADTRVGRGGAAFTCWKIRTMRNGLPRRCASRKICGDPRVTALGHLLRRSSLDELPQLIGVLRGEMSLVGPRHVPAMELPLYGVQQAHYLRMRPGLTGL